MVPEICCTTDGWTDGQTDEQTDGWTEKVTYRGQVGAPPKNEHTHIFLLESPNLLNLDQNMCFIQVIYHKMNVPVYTMRMLG